MKVTRSSES